MNDKEAKIMAADLGGEMSEVDLHGLYPTEALEKLELFLFANKDREMIRVIYGGGTGKLKEVVLNYFEKDPQVAEVVDRGASCLVFL